MATFRFRPGSPDLDIITPPPAEGNESATQKLSAPVPVSIDPDTGTDLAYVGEATCTQLGASHSAQCGRPTSCGPSTARPGPNRQPEQPAEFAAAYDASTHQILITGG